jgi:hypothetical protein
VKTVNKIAIQYADFPNIQSSMQTAAIDLQAGQDLNQQKEIARRIVEARFLDKKGAESFFTTPTQATALRYGQDIVKSVIPIDELIRLSQSTNLYAGIEYSYFEVMFYGLEGINAFADHLVAVPFSATSAHSSVDTTQR